MSRWRHPVLALALPFAYAMGWCADAILNETRCVEFMQETGPQVDLDDEWWPARTNCVVEGSVVERGDPTVFYAVFGFWLVVAGLLIRRTRWRVAASEWTAAGLALALLGTLWLQWSDENVPWPASAPVSGWVHLTSGDLLICVAVAATILLWMKEGERRSGRLATVAPVTAALTLVAVAVAIAGGAVRTGAWAALAAASALTVSCFAVTGFTRLRPRDWRLDVCALGLLGSMWLPWTIQPALAFTVLDVEAYRLNGWEWSSSEWWLQEWLVYADVLIAFAAVSGLAAAHVRGPLADPAISVRASVAALVAAGAGLGSFVVRDRYVGREVELDYGAVSGLCFLCALLAASVLHARTSVRPPAPGPAPTRRGP